MSFTQKWALVILVVSSLLASTVYDYFFFFRSKMCYYGVFDGHAGHRASQFAAEHLHKNIMLKLPKG